MVSVTPAASDAHLKAWDIFSRRLLPPYIDNFIIDPANKKWHGYGASMEVLWKNKKSVFIDLCEVEWKIALFAFDMRILEDNHENCIIMWYISNVP